MIELFYYPTPNGRKISILLEELELKYKLTRIDITKNEQFSESFLKISPLNKIPVIIDNQETVLNLGLY
jgi:GSH-dependent disulfide-bond oxidoreductase